MATDSDLEMTKNDNTIEEVSYDAVIHAAVQAVANAREVIDISARKQEEALQDSEIAALMLTEATQLRDEAARKADEAERKTEEAARKTEEAICEAAEATRLAEDAVSEAGARIVPFGQQVTISAIRNCDLDTLFPPKVSPPHHTTRCPEFWDEATGLRKQGWAGIPSELRTNPRACSVLAATTAPAEFAKILEDETDDCGSPDALSTGGLELPSERPNKPECLIRQRTV